MKGRHGKDIRGDHSTLTDLSAQVVDIIRPLAQVRGIAPGVFDLGIPRGRQNVRIAHEAGSILLTVRQASSVQQVKVFTGNIAVVKLAIARALRDRGIPISFRKEK